MSPVGDPPLERHACGLLVRRRPGPAAARPVVVLHGGPGAPGDLAPLARALAGTHPVLEPWQRRADTLPEGERLTVARHVDDLAALLDAEHPDAPPAVLGHSWGAMLALAFAAEHPTRVARLVLVGCGTFDEAARAVYERRCAERLREKGVAPPTWEDAGPDDDARLAALGRFTAELDGHDLLPDEHALGPCDARGHRETWDDMLACQAAGRYPAAFAAIDAPVLAVAGAHDLHPGRLVADGLRAVVPRLRFVELPRCGHAPWRERHARDAFLELVRDELAR